MAPPGGGGLPLSDGSGARPGGRLSFVSLGVADLVLSVGFYRAALARPPLEESRDMALFDLGGVRLALLSRSALATEMGAGIAGSGFGGIALAINVSRREEVAPFLERAQAAGARIVRPAAEASWGGHAGVFADPDGFLWEVAWNPRLTPP
jgi:catechol 2,3-dioxygenase-like lactoylglutathione lyase family enzyme